MKKLFKRVVGMMVVMTMLVQMFVMTTTVFAADYSETVILSNADFLNSEKWSASGSTPANISVGADNVLTMVQSAEKGNNTGLNIPSGITNALSERYLVVNYDLKLSNTSIGSGYGYRLGTLNLNGCSAPLLLEISQGKVKIDGVWKHGPYVYFAGDKDTSHTYVTDVSTLADWTDVTFIIDYTTGAQRVLINNELVASVDSMEGVTSANYPTGFYFTLPNAETNVEMTYYLKDFSMKACDGNFGLVSTNLNDGAENVDAGNLEFEFSSPVSAEDLEAALIIEDGTGTEADCTKTVTVSEDGKTAYVSLAGLTAGLTYTLTIPSTFNSMYGFTIAEEIVRSFTPAYAETVILSNADFLNSAKWSTDSTPANISVGADNVLTMVQSSTKGDNTVLTLQTGLSGALSQRYLVVNYDLKLSSTTVSGYNYRLGTLTLNGCSAPLTLDISQSKVSIDGVWKHGPYVYFAGDKDTNHTYVTDVSTLADWTDVTFIIDYTTGAQRVLINNKQVASVDSMANVTSANYPAAFALRLPNADSNGAMTYYVKDFSMKAYEGDFGLISTNLNDGAVNVDVDNLEFEFSSSVSAEDLEAALVIEDSTGTEVADCTKTVTVSEDGKTAYVSLAGLTAEATYTLTIPSTFKSLYGFTIAKEVVRSFAPIKVYPTEKVIATTDYFADPDNCTNTGWGTTGNKTITYNEEGGYVEYFYSHENTSDEMIQFNIDDTAGSGVLVTKFKMFIPQNSYVYYNEIRFTMDAGKSSVSYKNNGLSAYSIDDVGTTLYSDSIYDKWLDITYIVDFDNKTQSYYLGEELIVTENYTKYAPTKLNNIGFAMKKDSTNGIDGIFRLKDVSVRRVPGISPRINIEDRTIPANQSVKLTFSTPVAQSSLTENLTLAKDGATLDNGFEVVMLNNGYSALIKFSDLVPNESYSVVLDSELTDNYGQKLVADATLDFSTTYELGITSDSYYSSSDSSVTGKVYINKPYDGCTGGVLIVAGYTDNGSKMVNLDTADIDFTTNDYIENPVDFEINDANNEITSVKCYIWNNLTDLTPLIDAVALGIAE